MDPYFQTREELLQRLRLENASFDPQIDMAIVAFNAMGMEVAGTARWSELKASVDVDIRSTGMLVEFEYCKGWMLRELPLRFQGEDHSMNEDYNEAGLLRDAGDDFMEVSSRLMNGAKAKLGSLAYSTNDASSGVRAGIIGAPTDAEYDDPTEHYIGES